MRPKISGSGTDDNGAFTLPANSATDLNGSNTFWKTSTTGEMVHDVAFEAGSGSTGSFTAKGSYTSTSKTFGKSGSVERSGTFGINESAGDLAAMSSKTDMVMTYAGGSVDSMKAKFFPHVSGSGFDAHGSYSLSGSTTVAGTSGKANLSMTKTYTDGSSMELAGEVPFPIGGSFSTEFDYKLSGGAKASTFGYQGSWCSWCPRRWREIFFLWFWWFLYWYTSSKIRRYWYRLQG